MTHLGTGEGSGALDRHQQPEPYLVVGTVDPAALIPVSGDDGIDGVARVARR
jgi:hypothetical protein